MKSIIQRNREIQELRNSGLTYKKIGEKFKITSERVRQILDTKILKPDRDLVLRVLKIKYKKIFNDKLTQKQLLEDIEYLSKEGRKGEDVARRNVLIKYLHDELELPFLKIGVLLHRNHTTIIYSYYSQE